MISFPNIGYMGRLGNQMFQFASTLGISKKLSTEARFPLENCFNYQESGPFDPAIGRCIPVKCDLIDCFDIWPEYFIPERHINKGKYYHENKFGYNQEVETLEDDSMISGYFQTEKYFCDYRDLILSQFSFKDVYLTPAESYIKSIRNSNPGSLITSIHVRRGDYVMFPDHHPTCTSEYYRKAIETIEKEFGESIFIVFSDDLEWCRNEFSDSKYKIVDLENPYKEMCAMTLCDNNIIANSSFSWWGAWLNRKDEKMVISPSRWFGSAMNKDASDVYCKNWKVI